MYINIQLSLDPSLPSTSAVLTALASLAAQHRDSAPAAAPSSATPAPTAVADAPPAEEKKPRRAKTAEAAAPAKAEAPAPAPAAAPAPATAEPGSLLTREQVVQLVTKAMTVLGAERTQQVFKKIGAARVSAMEPAQYPKLVAALNEALAAKETEEGMLS